MADWYQIVKTIHILSATVLFGTGLGIAYGAEYLAALAPYDIAWRLNG